MDRGEHAKDPAPIETRTLGGRTLFVQVCACHAFLSERGSRGSRRTQRATVWHTARQASRLCEAKSGRDTNGEDTRRHRQEKKSDTTRDFKCVERLQAGVRLQLERFVLGNRLRSIERRSRGRNRCFWCCCTDLHSHRGGVVMGARSAASYACAS